MAAQLVAAEALSWPEGDALDVPFAQDEAQVAPLSAAGPAAYDAHARTHEDGFLEALTEGREPGHDFSYIRHDTSQWKAAVDGEWGCVCRCGRLDWGTRWL